MNRRGEASAIRPAEHERLRESLSAYVDGQLAESERARLERHLAGCAECQHELVSLRSTIALLQQLPMAPVPRSFTLAEHQPAPVRRPAPGFYWLRTATALAATVLFMLVAVDLFQAGLPGAGTTSTAPVARVAAPAAAPVAPLAKPSLEDRPPVPTPAPAPAAARAMSEAAGAATASKSRAEGPAAAAPAAPVPAAPPAAAAPTLAPPRAAAARPADAGSRDAGGQAAVTPAAAPAAQQDQAAAERDAAKAQPDSDRPPAAAPTLAFQAQARPAPEPPGARPAPAVPLIRVLEGVALAALLGLGAATLLRRR